MDSSPAPRTATPTAQTLPTQCLCWADVRHGIGGLHPGKLGDAGELPTREWGQFLHPPVVTHPLNPLARQTSNLLLIPVLFLICIIDMCCLKCSEKHITKRSCDCADIIVHTQMLTLAGGSKVTRQCHFMGPLRHT